MFLGLELFESGVALSAEEETWNWEGRGLESLFLKGFEGAGVGFLNLGAENSFSIFKFGKIKLETK